MFYNPRLENIILKIKPTGRPKERNKKIKKIKKVCFIASPL